MRCGSASDDHLGSASNWLKSYGVTIEIKLFSQQIHLALLDFQQWTKLNLEIILATFCWEMVKALKYLYHRELSVLMGDTVVITLLMSFKDLSK